MKIRKECAYCTGNQVEWEMGDVLITCCPGLDEDSEGNCKNFDPLEEEEDIVNLAERLGNTDISVTMTQGDIIRDIINSVEDAYLPRERCVAMLDFVLDLIDEYGPVSDDELSDSVLITLLQRKTLEREFVCAECGHIKDDKSLILFDIDLDPRCPYCGSADITVM